MQELDSAFIKRIQHAVDQGQVVLIAPPVPPLPRDRTETALATTLCLRFKLTRTEGQMLACLMTHEYATHEELLTAMNYSGSATGYGCMKVFISKLRKKLGHDIKIITMYGIGHRLSKEAREKILQQTAEIYVVNPNQRGGDTL